MGCPDFVTAPWRVVVDTREQTPWEFRSLFARDAKGRSPLVVHVEHRKLDTGDYTLEGHESRICLERKSLNDALNTFLRHRARFERELERMERFEFSAVMLEFDWQAMRLASRDSERRFSWASLDESIRAWRQRHGVHFLWNVNRHWSEINAMKEFRRCWNDAAKSDDAVEPVKWMVEGNF